MIEYPELTPEQKQAYEDKIKDKMSVMIFGEKKGLINWHWFSSIEEAKEWLSPGHSLNMVLLSPVHQYYAYYQRACGREEADYTIGGVWVNTPFMVFKLDENRRHIPLDQDDEDFIINNIGTGDNDLIRLRGHVLC